jgi:TRAP-type C4-dicarboxylate transport system substrate-binding protein
MRFPSSIVSLFASLVFWIAAQTAQAGELTVIHAGPPGSLYEISADEFARRVNRRLPESYQVAPLADVAAGDGPALLDAVTGGRADFALASSAMLTISDRFAIFELPYLIRSRAQVRAIRRALLEPYLQPAARNKGFTIIGLWEDGFRHITNDLQPLPHPRDLSGLSLAVPDNGWRARLFQSLGADPVPMAARDLADALGEQRIDGQEAPLADIAARNLHKTQRHLTLSDHLYSPAFLVMREARLQALPRVVREVIASEAAAMEGWVQKRAIAMESDLVDRLDRTMEVGHADTEAFQAASRSLYGVFVRRVPGGAKMIESLGSADEATATSGATE